MNPKVEYDLITPVKSEELEARTLELVLDVRALVNKQIKEQGITKSELAARMGISKSHLSNILHSQSNLTLETLARFEIALGIKLEIGANEDL